MPRALLIVDHGSRKPEAHAHLEALAGQVQALRPELAVYVGHLELAEPSIETAIDRAAADGASELVVYPLFLAPGQHLERDVPAAVARAAERHPGLRVELAPGLGHQPGLAALIAGAL